MTCTSSTIKLDTRLEIAARFCIQIMGGRIGSRRIAKRPSVLGEHISSMKAWDGRSRSLERCSTRKTAAEHGNRRRRIPYIFFWEFSLSTKERDGAIGQRGAIIHTSDGGSTWKSQESGVTYNLFGIHFVDAKTGWVIGLDGTLLHTRRWKQMDTTTRLR